MQSLRTLNPGRAAVQRLAMALAWILCLGPATAAPRSPRPLLRAIDNSMRYLSTRRATQAYARLAVPGVTRGRVRRSLLSLRRLVSVHGYGSKLQYALQHEFVCLQVSGADGGGVAHFTGYYEPMHAASLTRTARYRYPLYAAPAGLARWRRPHPTRFALEGADGLQQAPLLRGHELAWLQSRLDAYLVQVQGSARLRLANGRVISLGYGGHTAWPYLSIGQELVKDGKIARDALTMRTLRDYFAQNPGELNSYLPRNARFVFFRRTHGRPVTGSLGMPLTAEHSIATDKSLMPPGAPAIIRIVPQHEEAARLLGGSPWTRLVLDQDAGGAIRGAARVDVFMGSGQWAGERAGIINAPGQLYYLLLKEKGTVTGSIRFKPVPVPPDLVSQLGR